jgi:hypothetical protein
MEGGRGKGQQDRAISDQGGWSGKGDGNYRGTRGGVGIGDGHNLRVSRGVAPGRAVDVVLVVHPVGWVVRMKGLVFHDRRISSEECIGQVVECRVQGVGCSG